MTHSTVELTTDDSPFLPNFPSFSLSLSPLSHYIKDLGSRGILPSNSGYQTLLTWIPFLLHKICCFKFVVQYTTQVNINMKNSKNNSTPSSSNSPEKKLDRKTVERNRRIHMKGLCFKLTSLVPLQHFQPSKVSPISLHGRTH